MNIADCPKKNGYGICVPRLKGCTPGDETCLTVIRMHFGEKKRLALIECCDKLDRLNRECGKMLDAAKRADEENEGDETCTN